ncbi:MAG: hypothetical protein EU533_05230, partial [Promethearchaeota archaeon]
MLLMSTNIILFSHVIWTIIRAIGLGVSIDFYTSHKKKMHLYLTIGWLLWLVGGLFPLYANLSQDNAMEDIVVINNLFFAPMGTIFISVGILMHFLEISTRIIVIISFSILVIMFSIYFFIDFDTLRTFSQMINTFSFIIVFLFPILRRKELRELLGESIKWYYITALAFLVLVPILSILMSQGYSYGLYEVDDPLPLMIFYVSPISATFLIIVYLIHMEYSISTHHKNRLKDKYSHDLGNILQCIMTANDICNLNPQVSDESKKAHGLIEEKCQDAAEL